MFMGELCVLFFILTPVKEPSVIREQGIWGYNRAFCERSHITLNTERRGCVCAAVAFLCTCTEI